MMNIVMQEQWLKFSNENGDKFLVPHSNISFIGEDEKAFRNRRCAFVYTKDGRRIDTQEKIEVFEKLLFVKPEKDGEG